MEISKSKEKRSKKKLLGVYKQCLGVLSIHANNKTSCKRIAAKMSTLK